MKLSHHEVRKRYAQFLKHKGHVEVQPMPIVPQDDPTTLFTGSGMQQFLPYLLGEPHPLGTRVFDIQPCIRAQDIEEVGDNRHDTFFEMIGNWSFGDYFKKEQIEWFFQFLIDETEGLGLNPKRLYVTVFAGDDQFPPDEDTIEIWKRVFGKVGIEAQVGDRILPYDAKKNWWSRAGEPKKMPVGEPGGPTSEVFYDFEIPHDPAFGKDCHPNCDCGRYFEIGNCVFMTYKKVGENAFAELPKKNVDFGGGLERLLAAINQDPDVFKTDVFSQIIRAVESATNTSYENENVQEPMRIIADHMKTAVFIIREHITPSNKEQGYVLRRLLRRSMVKMRSVNNEFSIHSFEPIIRAVVKTYEGIYFTAVDVQKIVDVVQKEVKQFHATLERGMKELQKLETIDGRVAFDLYQSYGFPFEITQEIVEEKGKKLSHEEFDAAMNEHRQKSKQSAQGRFKGGLADQSEQTIKYHTATHLLHQALFDVLGKVRQEGSNITAERLRFDFSSKMKPTDEDYAKIEKIVNEKIQQSVPVYKTVLPKDEAFELGAKSFFKDKYPEKVSVYYISENENDMKGAYSKEFCGGPHVKNTKEIGRIEIYKSKKIGSNIYRIYAR